jgi:hypothetical protein
MNKKGKINTNIDKLLGAVLVILFVIVLAPVIFGADGLANTDFVADAPAWLVTLLTVIVGIGLVVLVFKTMSEH